MDKKIKIQKFISDAGITSRRKAEELIINKKVFVNNEVATIGQRVDETDIIKINNEVIKKKDSKFYILLNKPKNTICSLSDPQNRKTIYQHLKINQYCFSVGRLDFNTTGVIIITNDGDFANLLAHPSSNIKREYIAKLEKELNKEDLSFLNSDNVLLNGRISKQEIKKIGNLTYSVILNEGRNHHVKNLFLLVNNYVKELHRKKYGFLSDNNLSIGQWRSLTKEEIENLMKLRRK